MARGKAVLAGAALFGLLAVGAVVWLLSGESLVPSPEAPSGTQAASPGPARDSAPGAEQASPVLAKPAPLPAGGGTILGRLVRGSPPVPVPGEVTVSGRALAGRTVKAGADGRFSVEDLPREERFTLVAVSEGLLPGRMPALWIERRGLLDLGDLVLGPAQRLEVQVRDRGSHLVGGASVSVVRSPFFTQTMDWVSRQLRAPALPSPEASGRTDPRGTAVFESIPPGNWTVLVEAEGYARSASWAYVQEGEAREPVRVLLLPACELSGTVFGADGKALPSVAVQATPVDGSWPQEYGRVESTTDPAGAYRLPGLREGPVNLTVQLRPDLQQSAGTVQLPSVRRFDIHLGPGFSVKGKVLDDATKEPVAGASVTLQIWPPQGGPGQASARRESGADGSFLFESLPPGNLGNLQVRMAGYLDWPDSLSSPPCNVAVAAGSVEEQDVRLHRGAAVRGKVSDSAGKPVEGARVLVHYTLPNGGYHQTDPAITAADGTYRIENVGAGRVLVAARASGYYQPRFPQDYWNALNQGNLPEECSVVVEKSGEAIRDLVLSSGGVVEGLLVRADGGPAAGLRCSVSGQAGAGGGVVGPSDGEGRFRATAVAPGENLVVRIATPRGEVGASEPFRLGEGETVRGIRVPLKAGGGIAGRVRREDGRPAQGASLRLVTGVLNPAQSWETDWRVRSAATHPVGPDGEFRIEGIAPGKVTLLCSAEGAASLTGPAVDVPEGSVKEGVEVVLGPEWPVSGTVVNEAREPVAGARITVREEARAGMGGYNPSGEDPVATITDAEGRFQLGGLGEGRYEVSAEAPGTVRRTTKVKGGTSDVVLVLHAGAVIGGVVVEEADGKPIAGIPVQAGVAAQVPGPWRGKQGRTGEDGTFRLEGLDPDEEYVVTAGQQWGTGKTDHAPATVPRVKTGTTELRIPLKRGFAIAGTLVDEQGQAVSVKHNVQAIGRNAEGNPDWARQRSAQSDANGAFRLTGLEAGVYDLNVNPAVHLAQGGGYAPASLRSVNAGSEGLTVVLRKGLPITGRVVDEQGNAVPRQGWLSVTVSGEAGGAPASNAQVQPDGTFTTPALDPSRSYDLIVGPGPGNMGGSARGIAAGSKDVVVRVVRGGFLSGRVLDDSGAPVGKGVPVTALAEGAAPNQPGFRGSGATREDGTFTVEGLAEFKFRVSAGGGSSDFQPSTAAGTWAPGAADVEVRVKAGVAVSGRLVNGRGDSFPAQSVMATPEGVEGAQNAWTRPAEDGTFTIKGLPAGKVRVKAWTGKTWADCGVFDAPAAGLTVSVPDG